MSLLINGWGDGETSYFRWLQRRSNHLVARDRECLFERLLCNGCKPCIELEELDFRVRWADI